MKNKDRLSASIDAELLAAVEEAAAQRRGTTVSAWVSEALRLKLDHDRRLGALAALVTSYEAEHGTISDAEMLAASRHARQRAASSRSPRTRKAG